MKASFIDNKEALPISNNKSVESYRSIFIIQSIYLFFLTLSLLFLLKIDDTALRVFLSFNRGYDFILFVEAIFGVFVLPFMLFLPQSNRRTRQTGFKWIATVYISGAPFFVVAVFACGISWYRAILSQVLVFCLWSIACELYMLIMDKQQLRKLYFPVCFFLFFGLYIGGLVTLGFTRTGNHIVSFSVPALLVSWSRGAYLKMNAWLGISICFGAVILWLRKVMYKTQEN